MAAGGPARMSSSASGSSGPTRSSGRSTPGAIGWPTGSSSGFGRPTSTAPASCSGARPSQGSGSSPAARSCRPSCSSSSGRAGRTVVEVGVPHYPRTAGSPTGAKPAVILRAVRDFWFLRLRLWASPGRALTRGESVLGDAHPATEPGPAVRRRARPGLAGYSGRGPSRVPASPPRSSELMKSRKTSRRGSAGDAASPVDSRSSIEPASPSSGRTPARSRTSSAA